MPEVVIIAGSKSDNELVMPAIELAKTLDINVEYQVYSAHRDLEKLLNYLDNLQREGQTRVIVAVAGLAAALPGVVAARVDIPVIGVPCNVGPLNGIDALLSIVQMPKGVPVATMAIGKPGMLNAIYFAARILGKKVPANS